jgi:hypothetical protein
MHRQVRQEPLDFTRGELMRIPAIVKVDITLQPLQVGLLRAQRQMARAHALARHGEKPGGSVQVVV